jgi:hypothetical protein
MVKAGDTFRLVGVADRHTWVVLSDPAQDSNLQRIRDGALVSKECKEKHKEILMTQGAITPQA